MMLTDLWVLSFAALWVLIAFIAVAQALVIRHALRLERELLDASDGPELGAAVPPVRLNDLTGEPVTLAPRGRRLAVVFLSPACSACSHVSRMLRGLPEVEGIQVVAVIQASASAARRYEERQELPVQVLPDPDGVVLKAMQVTGIPFVLVLDARGRVERKGVPASFPELLQLLDLEAQVKGEVALAPVGAAG
jgi:peroxiredoxin